MCSGPTVAFDADVTLWHIETEPEPSERGRLECISKLTETIAAFA